MKNKSFHFVVPLVIYPFDVYVSVNESDGVLKKGLGDYASEWDLGQLMGLGETVLARAHMCESNLSVIRFNLREGVELCGLISHECFHIVTFVMRAIGMKMEVGVSDEAYAYLLGYLVGEVGRRIMS